MAAKRLSFWEPAGFAAGLALGLAAFAALAGDNVLVSIDKYVFEPQTVTVKAGTTVVWANNEKRTTHDVTIPSLNKASDRLMPGDGFAVRFDTPGRYPYFCEAHKTMPAMHGEVIVTE